MSVMRSSLIPGLVTSIAFNVRHKQERVRVFEIGRCFCEASGGEYAQPVRIGGRAYGDALPEQWGERRAPRRLLRRQGRPRGAVRAARACGSKPRAHPALHPGRVGAHRRSTAAWSAGSASCIRAGSRSTSLPLAAGAVRARLRRARARRRAGLSARVPKLPPVRRDIAALVDEERSHQAIMDGLRRDAPPIVTDVRLFDVYRGKDLPKGRKSLAFMVLCRILERL